MTAQPERRPGQPGSVVFLGRRPQATDSEHDSQLNAGALDQPPTTAEEEAPSADDKVEDSNFSSDTVDGTRDTTSPRPSPVYGSEPIDYRALADSLPRRQNPVSRSAHEGGLRPSGFFAGFFAVRKGSRTGIWPKFDDLSDADQRAHLAFWNRRQIEAEERWAALEYERLVCRLIHLANHGVTGIIFVANGKSTGKTRSLQIIGETLRHFLPGRLTDMMLATANLTTSTLNRMSDVPAEDRKSVVDYLYQTADARYAREIRDALPQTVSGAGVIGEMQANPNRPKNWGMSAFVRTALRITTTNSFLLLDGGNDDNVRDSVPFWAARLAHAHVYVYEPGNGPVIATLRSDVASFREDNASGPYLVTRAELVKTFADGFIDEHTLRLTGVDISTITKVQNAVVVANRAEAVDREEVAKYMRKPDDMGDKPNPRDWRGPAVNIPFIESLAGTRPGPDGIPEPNPCVWENLTHEEQFSALRLTVAALEAIAENRGMSDIVGESHKYETPVVIDES